MLETLLGKLLTTSSPWPLMAVIPLLICIGFCLILLIARLFTIVIVNRQSIQTLSLRPPRSFLITLLAANLLGCLILLLPVLPVWRVVAVMPLGLTVIVGANQTQVVRYLSRMTRVAAGVSVLAVLFGAVVYYRDPGTLVPLLWAISVALAAVAVCWLVLGAVGWLNYFSGRRAGTVGVGGG